MTLPRIIAPMETNGNTTTRHPALLKFATIVPSVPMSIPTRTRSMQSVIVSSVPVTATKPAGRNRYPAAIPTATNITIIIVRLFRRGFTASPSAAFASESDASSASAAAFATPLLPYLSNPITLRTTVNATTVRNITMSVNANEIRPMVPSDETISSLAPILLPMINTRIMITRVCIGPTHFQVLFCFLSLAPMK